MLRCTCSCMPACAWQVAHDAQAPPSALRHLHTHHHRCAHISWHASLGREPVYPQLHALGFFWALDFKSRLVQGLLCGAGGRQPSQPSSGRNAQPRRPRREPSRPQTSSGWGWTRTSPPGAAPWGILGALGGLGGSGRRLRPGRAGLSGRIMTRMTKRLLGVLCSSRPLGAERLPGPKTRAPGEGLPVSMQLLQGGTVS